MKGVPASDKGVRANRVELTEPQIRFYDDNGYLVVPGVFGLEACDEMLRAARTLAEEDFRVVLNIHRVHDLFFQVMKDPVLVAMVTAVQRYKVVGTNSQYLYKKAGTPYAKQAWSPHQDSAYVRAKQGSYMQLHILLDDQDKDNGGLFYYPGSHREGILPYDYAVSWKENFDADGISHPGWTIREIPSRYKRVDVAGLKGSVCLQHGNVIHGSYPNLSRTRSREQYSMAYLNEGESILKGRTSLKIPVPLT